MAKKYTQDWQLDYDSVKVFSESFGIYIVEKAGLFGVVQIHNDDTIEYVGQIEYDEIKVLFKNTYLLLAQKAHKKRVIKVTKSRIILSPYYDKIGSYVSYVGLIPVADGELAGAIDKDLNDIIPVQYDILENHAFHILNVGALGKPALVMKKNGKYGILNVTGETLLPFDYDEIDEGIYRKINLPKNKKNFIILPDQEVSGSGLIAVKKDKKWGLVDEVYFKEVVPCVYKSIRQDAPNKIELEKSSGHDILLMTEDGPQIQNISPNRLGQYSTVGRFEDGFAIVQKDGKFGFIDEEYNEVVPCVFDEVSKYLNGRSIVKKDGKYGYIDEKNKEIAPCVYDELLQFHHGIAIVRVGEHFGAINETGKIVIPIEYLILADISYLGPTMLMAIKERLFGVIGIKNNVIIPFEYDEVLPLGGMITVRKKNKKGLFNHKGQLIVPIEYDEIQHPISTSTSINVCQKGKWGVVNKKGQIICEPKYDEIDSFGFACGRLAVCRDGKWGFINWNGREVIECIYDKVYQFFEENHCEVKLNGKKIEIDIYGNRLL